MYSLYSGTTQLKKSKPRVAIILISTTVIPSKYGYLVREKYFLIWACLASAINIRKPFISTYNIFDHRTPIDIIYGQFILTKPSQCQVLPTAFGNVFALIQQIPKSQFPQNNSRWSFIKSAFSSVFRILSNCCTSFTTCTTYFIFFSFFLPFKILVCTWIEKSNCGNSKYHVEMTSKTYVDKKIEYTYM